MPTQPRAAEKVVRLYPVPGAYIIGEPAAEREVSPAEAERLLAFKPPAYTKTPPKPPAAPAEADAEPQE